MSQMQQIEYLQKLIGILIHFSKLKFGRKKCF